MFETFFAISMLLQFFLEFKDEKKPLPIRDFGKIANRYLRNEFFIDLLPLLPLPQVLKMRGVEQHFYIIKCIRILKCSEVFEVKRFMQLYI